MIIDKETSGDKGKSKKESISKLSLGDKLYDIHWAGLFLAVFNIHWPILLLWYYLY